MPILKRSIVILGSKGITSKELEEGVDQTMGSTSSYSIDFHEFLEFWVCSLLLALGFNEF